ncbi:MAG: hypothetical protein V9G42_05535 [Bacteroidia bacterium]
MRNQRFEQKKSIKDHWETDDHHAKKHKMTNHREEKNWKNKILKEEDDDLDENFFQFDDEE